MATKDDELWGKRRDLALRVRAVAEAVIGTAERKDDGGFAGAVLEIEALLQADLPTSEGTARAAPPPPRITPLRTMIEHVGAVTKTLEHTFNRKDGVSGLATGFRNLDVLTSGLQTGHLMFLAARPAMGKTALVSQIVCNTVTKVKKPVLYFSLDISAEELTQRMIATEASLDLDSLRRGYIQRHKWSALAMAAGKLSEAPLFIDDRPLPSIEHIVARSRQQSLETGIALIVVDHLQLIAVPELSGGGPRAARMAEVCLRLKALAQELGVPLVCLSQLGRGPECRLDHRPMMWDLRDSGAIEPAADLIAFLYRDEYYLKDETPKEKRGLAELDIAKNRTGPLGTVTLRFFSSELRFEASVSESEEMCSCQHEGSAGIDVSYGDDKAAWTPPPEPDER